MICTLHKVHEVNLHEGIMIFNLQRQKKSNVEQVYVQKQRSRVVVFRKYVATLQENTHAEVWFQ